MKAAIGIWGGLVGVAVGVPVGGALLVKLMDKGLTDAGAAYATQWLRAQWPGHHRPAALTAPAYRTPQTP